MIEQQASNLELPLALAIGAGETKVFYLAGSYFELIDCPNAVDVILSDRNGGVRARLIGALQTHHVLDTPFEVVQITSQTAQTIRFAYGSGKAGTRNTAGSVSILNPVDLTPASLATLLQPRQSTGDWKNTAAMVANTPLTVLAPGANTTGVDLLDAGYIQSGSGTTRVGIFFLMKSGAAPTSITDGEIICGPSTIGNDASAFLGTAKLHNQVFVPAGFGIYAIAQDAMPATAANNPVLRYARWRAR